MKKIQEQITFFSNSNNSKPIKAMTTTEKIAFDNLLNITKQNGVEFVAVTFCRNGNIYGFDYPIDNITNRIKCNYDNKKRAMYKFFCPISKIQADLLIDSNKVSYICTMQELEQIKVKKGLKTLGNAIEYALNKKYHTTINHKQSILQGGDAFGGNKEIKFFNLDNATGASVRLFEYVKSVKG